MKTRMQEELAGSLTKLISLTLENKHHHVQMTKPEGRQLGSDPLYSYRCEKSNILFHLYNLLIKLDFKTFLIDRIYPIHLNTKLRFTGLISKLSYIIVPELCKQGSLC